MSPWLASAAYPRHSPFSTLLHSWCARARNIISSLAENGQTQRKYRCQTDIQILKAFKHFGRSCPPGNRTRSRGKPDIATPGSHFWMATLLLNYDVNGGNVDRFCDRGLYWWRR